jgi:ssDNA-binding Zn-finger/Zn-ribbon topoisomerase 1
MKTHKAKFFCENCGAEVSENARFCRYCGRFFSAVRCPKCGKTGNVKMFENGCPNCGYAVETKNLQKNAEKKEQNLMSHIYGYRKNKKIRVDNSLPRWMYLVTTCALAGILIAIFSCIK